MEKTFLLPAACEEKEKETCAYRNREEEEEERKGRKEGRQGERT